MEGRISLLLLCHPLKSQTFQVLHLSIFLRLYISSTINTTTITIIIIIIITIIVELEGFALVSWGRSM